MNLTKNSATGASRIAINGISSSAGSATTGIYIDDTPIQVRNLGFGASTCFPGLFDIERVEVLRGPQGTLFGAGSEGGTVRFITTEPNLRESSLSVRSEVATLAHGEPTYELGTAAGGPIIADKLAYRFSAFYRREGGWIDGVDGTYSIKDPTGASYGDSVAFTKTSTLAKDINWNRTVALRGALKWQVSDAITVSPSIFYQKHHLNDGAGDVIDLSTSNIGNRDYSRQYYRAGAPGTSFTAGSPPVTTILNAMDAPTNAFGDDEFTLTSLGINWDLGFASLFSNTSDADLPRFKSLGVIANIQEGWLAPSAFGGPPGYDYARSTASGPLGPWLAGRLMPYGPLQAAGARLAAGSDWFYTDENPWITMEAGITSRDPGGANRVAMLPNHALDLRSVLRAHTVDAAFQMFRENEIGSLEPGKQADLIVLDRDPFRIDVEDLHKVRVLQTFVAGDVVYQAQPQ